MKSWLAVLGFSLIALPAAASETLVFSGTASDTDGGHLYQEEHSVTGSCVDGHWRPEKHSVDYLRHDGRGPFATKALTYKASPLRPEVNFHQPDFSERLVIHHDGDETLKVEWTMSDQPAKRWRVPLKDQLVVDAGFDHFIRANWRALTDGDAVGFSVLAPTRGESYDFVAEPAPDKLAGADYSFRIRPAGMLMRVLVDPIRLGYRDDGFLSHYAGLGNIRRNQDENHVVSIRYRVIEAPACSLLPPSQAR